MTEKEESACKEILDNIKSLRQIQKEYEKVKTGTDEEINEWEQKASKLQCMKK